VGTDEGIFTGKERRAEGESLNVLGWVSPIACGLGGGGAQGKPFQLSFSTRRPIWRRSRNSLPRIARYAQHSPKKRRRLYLANLLRTSDTQSSSLSTFFFLLRPRRQRGHASERLIPTRRQQVPCGETPLPAPRLSFPSAKIQPSGRIASLPAGISGGLHLYSINQRS